MRSFRSPAPAAPDERPLYRLAKFPLLPELLLDTPEEPVGRRLWSPLAWVGCRPEIPPLVSRISRPPLVRAAKLAVPEPVLPAEWRLVKLLDLLPSPSDDPVVGADKCREAPEPFKPLLAVPCLPMSVRSRVARLPLVLEP